MINNSKLKGNISEIKAKLADIFKRRNDYPIASKEEYESKKNGLINLLHPVMEKIYENNAGVFKGEGDGF